MAYELPPPPSNAQSGSFAWYDWYTKLRDYVLNLDFTHNSLASLQGGTTNEYYHLTSAQHTNLTSNRIVVNGTDSSITGSGSSTWTVASSTTASTAYRLSGTFYLGNSLSTTGLKFKIVAPAGATVALVVAVTPDVVSTSATYVKRTTTNDSYIDFTTTNLTSCSSALVTVSALCITSSTTGTITFGWKQSAEIGTALTSYVGSTIESVKAT